MLTREEVILAARRARTWTPGLSAYFDGLARAVPLIECVTDPAKHAYG